MLATVQPAAIERRPQGPDSSGWNWRRRKTRVVLHGSLQRRDEAFAVEGRPGAETRRGPIRGGSCSRSRPNRAGRGLVRPRTYSTPAARVAALTKFQPSCGSGSSTANRRTGPAEAQSFDAGLSSLPSQKAACRDRCPGSAARGDAVLECPVESRGREPLHRRTEGADAGKHGEGGRADVRGRGREKGLGTPCAQEPRAPTRIFTPTPVAATAIRGRASSPTLATPFIIALPSPPVHRRPPPERRRRGAARHAVAGFAGSPRQRPKARSIRARLIPWCCSDGSLPRSRPSWRRAHRAETQIDSRISRPDRSTTARARTRRESRTGPAETRQSRRPKRGPRKRLAQQNRAVLDAVVPMVHLQIAPAYEVELPVTAWKARLDEVVEETDARVHAHELGLAYRFHLHRGSRRRSATVSRVERRSAARRRLRIASGSGSAPRPGRFRSSLICTP